ncbi:hypothetical protein [Mycobacterium sp.]|uniref:hypothetical protein n=1 Tax=Mycobacterium sp. TaxID=1785 RepID=UPI003F9C0844
MAAIAFWLSTACCRLSRIEGGVDLQQFFLPEGVDVQLELQVLHHREAVVRAEVKLAPWSTRYFTKAGNLYQSPSMIGVWPIVGVTASTNAHAEG